MTTAGRIALATLGGGAATALLWLVTLGVVAALAGKSTSDGERGVVVTLALTFLEALAAVGVAHVLNRGDPKAAWLAPLLLGVVLLVGAPLLLMVCLLAFNR